MKHSVPIPFLALLPLAIAACGGPAGSGSAPAPAPTAAAAPAAVDGTAALLPGYHWQLSEASTSDGRRNEALFVRADAPLQLDFVDGRLAVSNACNHIGGGYSLTGGQLTVSQLVSTQMACVDPKLAALDGAISERLQGTLAIAGDAGDPPRLTLTTAAGEQLVFTGQPTAATRYGSVPERIFLEVDADTKPCSHPLIPDMQCLQVREIHYDDNGLKVGEPGEWQHFHEPIEGYTHTPGIRQVLRIDRFTRKDVPADASRHAYVLDMAVESEVMRDLD